MEILGFSIFISFNSISSFFLSVFLFLLSVINIFVIDDVMAHTKWSDHPYMVCKVYPLISASNTVLLICIMMNIITIAELQDPNCDNFFENSFQVLSAIFVSVFSDSILLYSLLVFFPRLACLLLWYLRGMPFLVRIIDLLLVLLFFLGAMLGLCQA